MVLHKLSHNRRSYPGNRAGVGAVTLSLLLLSLGACSGGDTNTTPDKIDISKVTASAEDLYNNGIDALRTERYNLAATQFETLQQKYPYSGYTPNAQLMEGYAYYLSEKYPEAVQQLNRFLQLHPTSQDAAYAYYLRALCFYEQIADVQRDQQGAMDAMSALQDVVTRFPGTPYAQDAQLKIDLCKDHLAGKEMMVGRWYEQQRNYEAAVNRFQRVVYSYQTTNHVAEALLRLTEVYLKLGLVDQARKTTAVLGYNYPGSKWYRYAYDDLKEHNLISGDTTKPTAEEPGFFSRLWGAVF